MNVPTGIWLTSPTPSTWSKCSAPRPKSPDIARQAVAIGAKALWTQIGLFSTEAREIAEAAGLDVVESQCMATQSGLHNIDKRP